MKPVNNIILVDTRRPSSGLVVDETTIENYVNSGTITHVTGDISSVAVGDMVHFSDVAGVYVDKSESRTFLALREADILFVGECNLAVVEDLSFEISSEINPRDKVCII